MSVNDAWLALGENPEEVVRVVSSCSTNKDKIQAIEKELARAERIARVLMAVHHPDKNTDDIRAKNRFVRVQEAIESLRNHTYNFIQTAKETSEKPKSNIDFIIFK